MHRVFEQFIDWGVLNDFTKIHYSDLVTDVSNNVEIVADKHERKIILCFDLFNKL